MTEAVAVVKVDGADSAVAVEIAAPCVQTFAACGIHVRRSAAEVAHFDIGS